MNKELPKVYNPADFEDAIYEKWEKSGFFNPDNLKGAPYSIMMPPPNVTGVLHLGHALENSLMDIMARYQRMKGNKVLLLPGTDHAAVATQAKVEKILVEQGVKNPRQALGREKLLEKIREYAENSKTTILKQIRKIGTSCDWSRLAYTFDETRSQAVNEIFVKMYNDGLIYRGKRIVNWDAKLQTTISDDEIVWQEEKVPFYYLKYGPFVIATARPETKFGDKYVVMHPDDERYKKYKHGDKFDCEWINGKVSATVIKDEIIDPKFGTGVMTITPWHDMVDFEIAERHKLSGEQIIDFHGKLMPIAGEFAGLDILIARPKIVAKLEAKGLVKKVEENYLHRVAKGDRSGGLVEPQIKEQWFVDVNKKFSKKNKSLKDLMREAVTTGHNGDAEQKVNITPERFEKVYLNWINNLRDWCISRQIWWGHRIPVWYKEKEVFVGVEAPGNSNFIFLHGFYRTREVKDPLNWLNKQLPNQDNFWKILPNPDKPNREEQEKFVLKNAKISENSIIVTHSLGSALALKIIQDRNVKIKKLVMLAPSLISHRQETKEYKNFKHDFEKIKRNVKEIIIFQAGKDHAVEPENVAEMAAVLGAKLVKVENSASHFNSNECQEILDELKKDYWSQDEDTLDTWFSSGLWTFSTLGWSGKSPSPPFAKDGNKDLKTFHPTSWMQMGYEILFFWMARMILMSTYALDQIPFKHVYIHGMLRNEMGKKFSKSSGNNIDPLEVAKRFGTDALRLSLISGIAPGNDSKFYEEKVEGARNLVNKLWNISRYILPNIKKGEINFESGRLTMAEDWILKKQQVLIKEVTSDLNNYNFSSAGERLREFTWSDLADWYLEANKFDKSEQGGRVLYYLLKNLLILWHPFIPFITEAIWAEMKEKNLLIIQKWPGLVLPGAENDFGIVKDIIMAIRNVRAENKIEPAIKIKAVIYAGSKKDLIESQANLIKNLRTGVSELEIKKSGKKIPEAISLIVCGVEIYLLVEVDEEKEKIRLEKEIANLEKIIKAAEARLANQEFIDKAPAEIVKKEKDKLAGWRAELKKLKNG